MSNTVLITGGLGYIGGRIAQTLSKISDYFVVLGTRNPPERMPGWIENVRIVGLDLLSESDLIASCAGVSTIIHLAALNEIESALDPKNAFLVNSLGTLNLIRAAERAGVERFIYFSTAHVYGAPLAGRITEQTITRPVHPYAITHKAAEDFVLAARDLNKIGGIVLRLSNGFGVPAYSGVNRWSLVVNDLCRQAVLSGRLVLKSSGLQKRDFVTLSDVAGAVIHLLKLPDIDLGNGLFNLGGENPVRIIEMAEIIRARCENILGFKPEITRSNPEYGDTEPELDFRIDKLKQTGFSLSGRMNDEIDNTLELCRKVFAQRNAN